MTKKLLLGAALVILVVGATPRLKFEAQHREAVRDLSRLLPELLLVGDDKFRKTVVTKFAGREFEIRPEDIHIARDRDASLITVTVVYGRPVSYLFVTRQQERTIRVSIDDPDL